MWMLYCYVMDVLFIFLFFPFPFLPSYRFPVPVYLTQRYLRFPAHTMSSFWSPFLPLLIIFLLQRLQVVFCRLDSFRMPRGALPRARLPRNPFNTVFFPPDHGNFVPPFFPPSLLLWPFIPLR